MGYLHRCMKKLFTLDPVIVQLGKLFHSEATRIDATCLALYLCNTANSKEGHVNYEKWSFYSHAISAVVHNIRKEKNYKIEGFGTININEKVGQKAAHLLYYGVNINVQWSAQQKILNWELKVLIKFTITKPQSFRKASYPLFIIRLRKRYDMCCIKPSHVKHQEKPGCLKRCTS